jgi:hypothetical protein
MSPGKPNTAQRIQNGRTSTYVGSWEYVQYAVAGSLHGLVFSLRVGLGDMLRYVDQSTTKYWYKA